jgi:5-methylcytosine-specific restriction endonuclease McrA
MPSDRVKATVFERDRWACRYCGEAVFLSPALRALEELSPGHGYWHGNGRRELMTKLLLDRCAAVDHVNPVTRGGGDELENLVCACWSCNTKKSDGDPAEWRAKLRPSTEARVAIGWDGLFSVLRALDPENPWLAYFRH